MHKPEKSKNKMHQPGNIPPAPTPQKSPQKHEENNRISKKREIIRKKTQKPPGSALLFPRFTALRPRVNRSVIARGLPRIIFMK